MKQKSVLILSLLFTLGFPFYASAQTAQNLRIEAKDGLSVEKAEEFRPRINGINKMISPDLKVPKNVLIRVFPVSDNAFQTLSYPKGYLIETVYQLILVDEAGKPITAPKNPKLIRAVTDHEYGHAIFNENLFAHAKFQTAIREQYGVSFKEYLEYSRLLTELEFLKNKGSVLEAEAEALVKAGVPETDPRVQSLIKKLNLITKRMNEVAALLHKLDPKANLQDRLIGGCHELFADVIAVAFNKNPRAIFDALYSPRIRNHVIRGKDVPSTKETAAEKRMIKKFALRRFDLKVDADSHTETSVHTELTPVRSHIWKYYMTNPIYNRHTSKMIRAIFDGITDSIIILGEDLDQEISPQKINELIIQKIDEKFKVLRTKL